MRAPLAMTFALTALLSLSPARAAAPYAWNAVDNGELVQFSRPDTDDGSDSDDRLLRVDCDDQGHIYIGGPFASGAANGDTSGEGNSVTFESGTFHEARMAEMVRYGNGAEFSALVDEHDPAIEALLRGQSLTITHAGRRWTVPGRGAAPMLRRLLDICRPG
jgi:hypothetical protein